MQKQATQNLNTRLQRCMALATVFPKTMKKQQSGIAPRQSVGTWKPNGILD